MHLSVNKSQREGFIHVQVEDDGPGISVERLKQLSEIMAKGYNKVKDESGIGIANVQKRLQLSFPGEAEGLVISSRIGEGTVVSFEIPNYRLGEQEQ